MASTWHRFSIMGTAGRSETYFGGWGGLSGYVAEVRGDTYLFEGGHCEEDVRTLDKVVGALYR